MARGKMYQYTVLYHPSPADVDGKSTIIVPVTSLLATCEKEVAIKASKRIPDEYESLMDRVEIIIRPF